MHFVLAFFISLLVVWLFLVISSGRCAGWSSYSSS